MSLNARRIALQGIGAGALALAVQGFTPADVVQPPAPQPFAQAGSSGSAGRGQMSNDEWRRLKQQRTAHAPAAAALANGFALPEPSAAPSAIDAQAARIAKRRREEETLFLLG